MTAPGASGSDPTATAAEELRWRLGALVSRYEDRLPTEPEAWRACELELSPFYAGPYAVRTYAVVQALKHGLVADLVAWHADGARGVDAEIAQRLVERSGVSRPIAEWAVSQWAFAFRLHEARRPEPRAEARTPTPAAAAVMTAPVERPAAEAGSRTTTDVVSETRTASNGGLELHVGIPQLVGAGALVAVTLASIFGPKIAASPRVASLFGASAVEAPALPPAPALESAPVRGRPAALGRDTEAAAASASCASDAGGVSPASSAPRLLRDVTPSFPPALLDAGVDRGSVMLRYAVDTDGRVDRASVEVLSATDDLFARSAIDAVTELRYRPARRDGCATRATVTRTVRFRR